MITYSILETILLCAIMPEEMQGAALLEQLVKTFLPFITRKYWFYSTYVCLFIISGYIQKFLDSLEKKEFERLLIILLFLFSVLPTVTVTNASFNANTAKIQRADLLIKPDVTFNSLNR